MAQSIIDLVAGAKKVVSIQPATYTVTTQGSTTLGDFSNGAAPLNAVVAVGAFSAQNSTIYVQIEEATTTGGPWTVISGMSGAVTTTGQQDVAWWGVRQKRFARANMVTCTGTTPSVALGVVLIEQKKIVGGTSGVDRSPST